MTTNIILNHSTKGYGNIPDDIYKNLKKNEKIKLDNDLTIRLGTIDEISSQNLKEITHKTTCKIFIIEEFKENENKIELKEEPVKMENDNELQKELASNELQKELENNEIDDKIENKKKKKKKFK